MSLVQERIKEWKTLNEFLDKEWFEKLEEQSKKHPIISLLNSNKLSDRNFLRNLDQYLLVVKDKLAQERKRYKINRIKDGLQRINTFYETVVEIIWLARWIKKGILVDIEPMGKNKLGPDAKLIVNGKYVFCEILAVNIPKEVETHLKIKNDIESEISNFDPKFDIHVSTRKRLRGDEGVCLSERIKKEIESNQGKEHFNFFNDDMAITFAKSLFSKHYVEIHYVPLPTDDIKIIDMPKKLCRKVSEKIKQLYVVGNFAKILIIDYGRQPDSLGLHPFFYEPFFEKIFEINRKELSTLITHYHIYNSLFQPEYKLNNEAEFPLTEEDLKMVACFEETTV